MKRFLVKSRFFNAFLAASVLCLATACEDVTGYKDSPVDGYVVPKNFSVCQAVSLLQEDCLRTRPLSTKQERMVYYVSRTITLFSSAPLYGFMQK